MRQSDRIHHRCRCLDRNFTSEEWSQYLRENPIREAVLTVGAFQFNISDVCLNPNRPVRIEKNRNYLEIRTAQSSNGRWDYGLDLGLYTEVRHFGATFIDDPDEGFPTEKEAVYDCLVETETAVQKKIEYLEQRGDIPDSDDDEESGRQPKASAVLSSLRAFLKEIQKQKEYHDPRQLSLFDL